MKEYNLVIVGVGGQGILTLSSIVAEAALAEGYDVKTSEIHGLSQRYGHVPCHVRFGSRMYSPLVREGEANLIVCLEVLEALRACYYGSKENKTTFLIDTFKVPPLSVSITKQKYPSIKKIVSEVKKFSTKVLTVNASEMVEKETGSTVMTNTYIVGYASAKKLIPLKKKSLLEGIKKVVPEEYFDINKRIFELASA